MPAPPRTWYQEALSTCDWGVDVAQIDARLKLTPTERLETMRRFLLGLEELKKAYGHRLPAAD